MLTTADDDAPGFIQSRPDAPGLTPEEALARARTFAEEEAADRRGDGGGEGGGSRGGWSAGDFVLEGGEVGFASGLDAPTLTPDLDLDGDAFGPSLSASGSRGDDGCGGRGQRGGGAGRAGRGAVGEVRGCRRGR